MAGYIGTGAVPQATQKRQAFTATAGQTTFATSGYSVGFVDVYMNGVKLAAADYTAINGSDVVLATAALVNDIIEIISFSTFEVSAQTFTGDVTASGGTFLPTGDTSAGDAAAMGYAAADGLVLTGQGSTSDVTIKNDADATVMSIPTGTTGVTFAGTPTFPDGSINIADLDIDGGTDIGAALVDADLMVVDDGAGGTNRKATMSRLATYMGTKIGGGMEFISSSGEMSGAASASFTGFDSSKYDNYVFYLNYVKPSNDNQKLYAYASTNGGSSYDETNGNYHFNGIADTLAFNINHQTPAGNDTNEYGIVGELRLFKPQASAYTTTYAATVVYNASGYLYRGADGDYRGTAYLSTSEVNAIQFKFGGGNIASGEIVMFGIVNS